MIYLHRVILGAPAEIQVDHRDGDGLNNLRKNLRVATQKQNLQGFQRKWENTTSIYRGVRWHHKRKKWTAQLKTGGHSRYIGCYEDEQVAARARDAYARSLGWPEEGMNFPITEPVLGLCLIISQPLAADQKSELQSACSSSEHSPSPFARSPVEEFLGVEPGHPEGPPSEWDRS